jgi:hypothetical protein
VCVELNLPMLMHEKKMPSEKMNILELKEYEWMIKNCKNG